MPAPAALILGCAAGIHDDASANDSGDGAGSTSDAPFSLAFDVFSGDGHIWIAPDGSDPTVAPVRQQLFIKGANWFGFQGRQACVNELWKHTVQRYIDFLVRHRFNAVRLPLSVPHISADPVLGESCGEYRGFRSLDALLDVVRKLRDAGIFVMFDVHTLSHPEENNGLWCLTRRCTDESEAPLISAWEKIASRFCSEPNVIAADLFNEPFGASWGTGNHATDWNKAAERIGDAVLDLCPRWLIVVEGIGNNGGACKRSSGYYCLWGENLIGQLTRPVRLSKPNKLVLSPHVYGHKGHAYLGEPNLDESMPLIWDAHFGRVQVEAGVPMLLGEWGGIWTTTDTSTAAWQIALQRYLLERGYGFFYWSLNDNSLKTGGLFEDNNSPKWDLLDSSPVLLIGEFQRIARSAIEEENDDGDPWADADLNPSSPDLIADGKGGGDGNESDAGICSNLVGLQDLRSLEPPQGCNDDADRREITQLCEGSYISNDGGSFSQCLHDAANGACVISSRVFDCHPEDRSSKKAVNCTVFASLVDLRALQPKQWCSEDAARNETQLLCHGAYATRDNGRISRCVHDASRGVCALSTEEFECPADERELLTTEAVAVRASWAAVAAIAVGAVVFMCAVRCRRRRCCQTRSRKAGGSRAAPAVRVTEMLPEVRQQAL